MRSSNTQAVVKELSRKYGFTDREIFQMVRAPFEFVVETMRNSDRNNLEFPTIRIKKFVTFYCSEQRKEYFRKLRLKLQDGRRADFITRREIIPVYPRTGGSVDEG